MTDKGGKSGGRASTSTLGIFRITSLAAIALVLMASVSHATMILPSGIIYYVNITLQNTQSNAVTPGTQLKLLFNASQYTSNEESGLQNVEVFNTMTGQVLTSWLEGNQDNEQKKTNLYFADNIIYWIVYPQGIAAGATVSNAIAFGFAPLSSNLFSATGPLGEAPQLSPYYAEYDNGNQVFSFYDNFYGSSLDSQWNTGPANTLTYTINNGLTMTSSSASGYIISNTYTAADANIVMDFYGDTYQSANNAITTDFANTINGRVMQIIGYNGVFGYISGTGKYGGSLASSATNGIWSVTEQSNTIEDAQLNYGIADQASTSYPNYANMGIQIAQTPTGNQFSPAYFLQYVRTRIMPPNTVMPKASLGPFDTGQNFIVSVSGNTGNQYETTSQVFSYVLNMPIYYATANVLFQVYNGVSVANVAWENNTVAQQCCNQYNTFTFNYQVPLVPSNGVTYIFNALLYTTNSAGLLSYNENLPYFAQTELYNYVPKTTIIHPINPNNVLLGDNITFDTNINQVNMLNAVSVAGYVQLGTQQISEYTIGLYNYEANVISFIPSAVGLPMPSLANPKNLMANSIVQLSFNGNSVFRNVTNISFQIYNESLMPCAGAYTTQAVAWRFYNVSNPTSLWNANVLGTGHFVPKDNAYSGGTQSALAVGFNSPATGNVYATCMYPSWGTFNITGTLEYNATGTLKSNFFPTLYPISNTIVTQRLYLENQPAPVLYDIYILNQQTQTYIAGIANIYSFYSGNSTSILLSQISVPSQSGAPITLEAGNEYTFSAYSPNGQVFLGRQGPLVAAQCSSSPCSYVIYVNSYNITNPQKVFGDISTTCFNTTTSVANQLIVSCSYFSKSGTSYNIQLYGYKNGVILGSPICINQQTASSGTVSCTFNSITANQYLWQLKLNQSGAYQPLNSGIIGTIANLFGIDAVWFALLIIITLSLLFLTKSVVISVIMFDAGWTVMFYLGLINAGFYTIPFLWIISAVVLYLLNRKG